MGTPEELSLEIDDKITLWLAANCTLVRHANSDQEWNAIEAKLRKFLHESGFTERMVHVAEVNLLDRVEEQYSKIYPTGGGFREISEPFKVA